MPTDSPSGAPPPPPPSRPAAPTIVNPALRKNWVREEPAAQAPQRGPAQQGGYAPRGQGSRGQQKPRSGSMIWAMAFAFVVVGGVLLVRPPDKPVAPTAETAQATGSAAPIPVVPLPVVSPDLERVFGAGTPGRAGAEAARVGQASAEAVVCGLQPPAWLNRARDAWADTASGRYPSFEENSLMTVALKSHLVAAFMAGQQQASNNLAARGKDAVCTDVRASQDYQAAVRTVSQSGQ